MSRSPSPNLVTAPRPSCASGWVLNPNAIPRFRNGEVPRYTGILNFSSRIASKTPEILASQFHKLQPGFPTHASNLSSNFRSSLCSWSMFFTMNMVSAQGVLRPCILRTTPKRDLLQEFDRDLNLRLFVSSSLKDGCWPLRFFSFYAGSGVSLGGIPVTCLQFTNIT